LKPETPPAAAEYRDPPARHLPAAQPFHDRGAVAGFYSIVMAMNQRYDYAPWRSSSR